MRKLRKILFLFLLLLAIGFLLPRPTLSGWDVPRELPGKYRTLIQHEFFQASEALEGAAADVDVWEDVLAQDGFSVLNTDSVYPSYLENAETLTAFWDGVCAGKDSMLSLFRVLENGGLRHLFFLHEDGQTLFFTTDVQLTDRDPQVTDTSVLPVYDMELADWGIFYYRVYPANDPHYVDYAQLRLRPPDKTLYNLNRAYVLPVEYQMVNLFLCDWQEGNWGNLSFHDLLEALYKHQHGERFQWEAYGPPSQVRVPATVFESTILPYFQISQEELRGHCGYDAANDTYPWRSIHGDDLTTWGYPMCEPEVVSYTENPDSTLTLEIQVYSPELKTDRLFCHTLTVRPLENGGFQYVSNEITYVSDQGLPYHLPRFSLDR